MPPRHTVVVEPKEAAISTDTIDIGLAHPTHTTLQSSLFFRSEQWLNPLRLDVESLFNDFQQQWIDSRANGEGEAEGEGGSKESPFELFKRLWNDKGWNLVHLLGIPDGPHRLPWGESVLRAFGEHLVEGETPLRQIAALFAVYTFCATQSQAMRKQWFKVDIPTLDHILSMPSNVAPSLDPSPPEALVESDDSTPRQPLPSRDVSHIVKLFLSKPFHQLVPTEIYRTNYPMVTVRDVRVGSSDGLAKQFLGIEEEMALLRRGTDVEEIETLTRAYQEEGEAGIAEGRSGGGITKKTSRRSRKNGQHRWIADLSSSSRMYASSKRTGSLVRPQSQLQLEVLQMAEEATMGRVEKAKLVDVVERGLEGTLSNGTEVAGRTKKRMLELVKPGNFGNDGQGDTSGKRKKTTSAPLSKLDEALNLLLSRRQL